MQISWVVVILLLYTAILVFTIASGIRRYQVSGFGFYLVGCSIRSITIIVTALMVISDISIPYLSSDGILFFGFILSYVVELQYIVKIRQTFPAEWKTWADKATQARQSSRLDRWLLPTIEKSDLVTPTLPNGRRPKKPSEMIYVTSSHFPIVHWFLIGGGIFELLIGLAIPSHPNPYLSSSLVFIGLCSIVVGGAILFASRNRQISTLLMFLSPVLFLIFLYLMIRMFTYSQ
ncbi:MAG: hypothetical protein SXV54_24695 [Chloroflexota bacterium]|nr:hypothetical protein [Chloroflexota bacterium]